MDYYDFSALDLTAYLLAQEPKKYQKYFIGILNKFKSDLPHYDYDNDIFRVRLICKDEDTNKTLSSRIFKGTFNQIIQDFKDNTYEFKDRVNPGNDIEDEDIDYQYMGIKIIGNRIRDNLEAGRSSFSL